MQTSNINYIMTCYTILLHCYTVCPSYCYLATCPLKIKKESAAVVISGLCWNWNGLTVIVEVMQHRIKILLVACSGKDRWKDARWFLVNEEHQFYTWGHVCWKLLGTASTSAAPDGASQNRKLWVALSSGSATSERSEFSRLPWHAPGLCWV